MKTLEHFFSFQWHRHPQYIVDADEGGIWFRLPEEPLPSFEYGILTDDATGFYLSAQDAIEILMAKRDGAVSQERAKIILLWVAWNDKGLVLGLLRGRVSDPEQYLQNALNELRYGRDSFGSILRGPVNSWTPPYIPIAPDILEP